MNYINSLGCVDLLRRKIVLTKHGLIAGVILLCLMGCSNESLLEANSLSGHKAASIEAKQSERTKYLAYEHQVTVELPKENISLAFDNITSFCAEDTNNQCTILHSSLYTGDYSSSDIEVRILPEGVNPLLKLISAQGEISNKSTDVEDLQEVIANGDKRLEMLLQYQIRLLELEKNSSDNVESLIKVAQQLSQVQSDIEYAQGAKAKLLQRTQMDIVRIALHPLSYTSFWGPIADSSADFGENLSDGIAQAIIAVPYLLPWALIAFLLIYVFRIFWRKTQIK